MTDIPQIDIPQDVMDNIQNNSQRDQNQYLGESIIPGSVIRFHRSWVRIYIFDESWDPTTTPTEDLPTDAKIIPDTIVYEKEQYKLAAVFNRVAAKTLAKSIKGFSITPFNI